MSDMPLLDIQQLTSSNNILIIGNRNTGKTELIKHIVSLQEPNTKIYLFTRDTNDYNFKGMVQKQVYKNCIDTIMNQDSSGYPEPKVETVKVSKKDKIKQIFKEIIMCLERKEESEKELEELSGG